MKKILQFSILIMLIQFVSCGDGMSGDITNSSNWSKILIGTWNYDIEFENVGNFTFVKGDVEYFPDSTFSRTITLRIFWKRDSYSVSPKEGREDVISGGTLKGSWEIDTENNWLIETITDCNMKTSKYEHWDRDRTYDGCTWYSIESIYGTYKDDLSQHFLKSFNNQQISVLRKYLSSGDELQYIAHKN